MQGSASLFDEGRFGPVYRSHDPQTNGPVLIRTFAQPLTPDEQARLVEALTRLCESPLDHPSIARPLVAGIENGRPFLVHTLLPGVSLSRFLQQHGPQPFPEVVVRITQLAAALDFAAAAGVHHGDLGAGDVILDADATGISGFGVAQALEDAGIGVHGPSTAAGDIRSLAQTAYELLTGRPLADPTDAREVAVPEADAARLQEAFAAALHEDPQHRPATALGFAAALQQAIVEADARVERLPVAEPVSSARIDPPALADLPLREIHEAPARFADVEPPAVAASATTPVESPVLREPPAIATAPRLDGPGHQSAGPGAVLMAETSRERETDGNGWLLVTAALAVGILGGFTGGFIVGQRSDLPAPPVTAGAARSGGSPAPAPTAGVPAGSAAPAPGGEAPQGLPSGVVVAEPEITSRDLGASQSGAAGTANAPASTGGVIAPAVSPARPAAPVADGGGSGDTAQGGSVPAPQSPGAPQAGVQTTGPAPVISTDTPGGLQVLSRPEGAQVFVDGALVGRTPLLIASMRPGTHDVRLELAGHQRWATRVRVEAGARARVAASLEQ